MPPAARARARRRRHHSHTPTPPTHPPTHPLPASPHRTRRTRLQSRATQGAVLYASDATITFASTLPVNSFSGNTAPNNNYGNCYKYSTTITGSCS